LRIKTIISWIVSLAMIGAGVALIASFFLAGSRDSAATNSPNPDSFNVPQLGTDQKQPASTGPEDKTLKLTIPAMNRIEGDTVPDVPGTDMDALGSHAAIHLEGTGYPWQNEANVYLAGHRLGYANTDSWLAFWDLDNLENGDEVFVEDANGTRYTYKVSREFVVGPSDLSVTRPEPGKNILTLQTCTLPDYSQRLIVQSELVNAEQKAA
jgi:sortase A